MSDYANLAAFLSTLGQTASGRKPVKLAPGGPSSARPAPSRFKAEGGISDSQFVKQIIDGVSAQGGGTAAMSPTAPGMGMPQPPQMPQAPQMPAGGQAQGGGGGGLAALLAGLGGGG